MAHRVGNFILYHKNVPVLRFSMRGWQVEDIFDVFSRKHAPVGTYDIHGVEWKKFSTWFALRSIPASRDHIRPVLAQAGLADTQELLAHSFAMSLSDQYWIYPEGETARWEDLNFFQNDFSEDWGDRLIGEDEKAGGPPDLRTPDNTSDGWLRKRWKIRDGKRYLYKGGSAPYRQEPINEKIASRLCERLGIRHISYEITALDNGLPVSVCEDYITPQTELVTAQQISTLSRRRKDEDYYRQYVRICQELGLADIETELSHMIVVDMLMANRDRHWTNFGVVRNADDLSFIESFPIYDTGTSLWNDVPAPHIRNDEIIGRMLERPLEEHLRFVKDRSFLSMDDLWTFPEEARDMLASSEYVTTERADRIAEALRARIRYLDRWLVRGISFLREGLAPYDADYAGDLPASVSELGVADSSVNAAGTSSRAIAGGPGGPVYVPDDDSPGALDKE